MDLRAEKIALDLEHLGCHPDYLEKQYHRVQQDVVRLKNEKSQLPTALPTLEDVEDRSIAIVRQIDEDYE
jgi:prefoldin subunit 5